MTPKSIMLPIRIAMGIGGVYVLQRFMMLGCRHTRAEYAEYERAEAILVGGLLRKIPVNDPESVIWDNRRKPK